MQLELPLLWLVSDYKQAFELDSLCQVLYAHGAHRRPAILETSWQEQYEYSVGFLLADFLRTAPIEAIVELIGPWLCILDQSSAFQLRQKGIAASH